MRETSENDATHLRDVLVIDQNMSAEPTKLERCLRALSTLQQSRFMSSRCKEKFCQFESRFTCVIIGKIAG
jgi:hypothetical protein